MFVMVIKSRNVDWYLLEITVRVVFRAIVHKVVVNLVKESIGSSPLDKQCIVTLAGEIHDDR